MADIFPMSSSLSLLERDTVRVVGTGFIPGMKVFFGDEAGHTLGVSDTLIELFPPLPQEQKRVAVEVAWPKTSETPSITIPWFKDRFWFLGPVPANPLVYDYQWLLFMRYVSVRWSLQDPELKVWFDPSYPSEHQQVMMRGFRKWEGLLRDGAPRFRQVKDVESAHFRVLRLYTAGARPVIDETETHLQHVEIYVFILLDPPIVPAEELLDTAVHEMGHGLGLWQHSPYLDDVMSNFGAETLPSRRDIETLRYLYSSAPDITD